MFHLRAKRKVTGPVSGPSVGLRFASSSDAVGLEIPCAKAKALDLRESYWRRVVFVDASGAETYVHSDASTVEVPTGAVCAHVFALPPDGRNNTPGAFVRKVPVPVVA